MRWRLIDLTRWLYDEFGISLTETTIGRELKKLGYVKLKARPRHHSQNEHAMEEFEKGARGIAFRSLSSVDGGIRARMKKEDAERSGPP